MSDVAAGAFTLGVDGEDCPMEGRTLSQLGRCQKSRCGQPCWMWGRGFNAWTHHVQMALRRMVSACVELWRGGPEWHVAWGRELEVNRSREESVRAFRASLQDGFVLA